MVDLVDCAVADVQEFVAVRNGQERDPACLREREAVMHTVGRQGRGKGKGHQDALAMFDG